MLFIHRQGMEAKLVKRPSTARYERLAQELVLSQASIESGQSDALAAAEYALASVIEFLNAEQAVIDAGITNSLSIIVNALHDRRHGGRPASLFNRPAGNGRATDQAFDGVKAAAACGIEVLLSCGTTRRQAGRFVADQTRMLGLRRPDGRDIDGKVVLRWRDEIETAKSKVGAEVFRRLKARRARNVSITELAQAKALARKYLVQVRFAGFYVSHAQTQA